MTTFPFRHFHTLGLPTTSVNDVRRAMTTADADIVGVDAAAIEILSLISGKRLMPSGRKALLSTLEEFLEGQPSSGLDYGPFEQVDILGAILGVTHFVLVNRGSWLFVRVPELAGKNNKTADIFAIPRNGKPWHLELKASAPMSDDFKLNASVDLCYNRLRQQVGTGLKQLANTTTSATMPTGAPGVSVTSPQSAATYVATGGKALSLIILPDGEIGRRSDILPPKKLNCPLDENDLPHVPCNVKCLTGSHVDKPTSIVGLLWQEPYEVTNTSDNAPDDDWNGILTAVAGVQFAVWAGSTASADESLLSLAERLASVKREREDVETDALFFSMLKQTRTVASLRARHSAINQLVGDDISSLSPEYNNEFQFGRREESPMLDFSQISNDPLGNDSDFEFQIDSNGYRGFGRVRNGNIAVVPSVAMIDQHSADSLGRDNFLGLSAAAALQTIVSSAMGGSRTRNLFPSLVFVNGIGDGNPWTVGYRTDIPREPARFSLPFNDYIALKWYHMALKDSHSRATLYPLWRWFNYYKDFWSNYVGHDEKHLAGLFEQWLNVVGVLALDNPENPLLYQSPPWSMTPIWRPTPGGYTGWAAYDGRIQLSRIS